MFNKFIERKRILQGMTEHQFYDYLKIIYPDLEKTNQFDPTDVYSINNNMRSELKCRRDDFHSFLIEKIKWDKLMGCTEQDVFYMCSSHMGIWKFRVQELPEPLWGIEMHNKTTEFGDNTKIPKVVGYYPKELGTEITDEIL